MFYFTLSNKRTVFFNISVIVIMSIILLGTYLGDIYNVTALRGNFLKKYDTHDDIVRRYLEKRKKWKTSNLGSLLFKFNLTNDVIRNSTRNKNNKRFIVLIWKHWDWLKNRHIFNFNKERKSDPLDKCSVKNCLITGDNKYLKTADAIVIHIQRGLFLKGSDRNKNQRWIFLSDESPVNSFSMAQFNPKFEDLKNIFNWSMTYRSDSDVPVPYGRTVPLSTPLLDDVSYTLLAKLVPHWNTKRRDKLATILISNCKVSRRMEYLKELEEYLPLDVYGLCSTDQRNRCPGHFRSDCKVTTEYLFYLVFENSLCREYLTEKVYHNAYDKGAIPIIMGANVDECSTLLPPNSFLHVDNFSSPKKLAEYITFISKNDEILLEFHRWRNDFKIVNEHGYFGTKSFHYCRVCEALNYNDEREKVYDENDLRSFLDPKELCHI